MTSSKQSGSNAPVVQLFQDLMASEWPGQALAAAVELDFFTHIAKGNATAQKIAAAAGASEHGTRRLLDALAALGYLKKSSQTYRLTAPAAEFLVRGKPFYMGSGAKVGKMMAEAWSNLANVVRDGRPFTAGMSEQDRESFFTQLVPAIFPVSFTAASAVVKKLPVTARRRIKRILDIGAGSAAWSIPFAKAIKAVRVTVADYPEVTQVTRQFTQAWGVADQYDYIEGDFHQVDFGAGQFDLVILGHIVHGVGAEQGQRLLKRTCDALSDGGLLLIGDFLPNDDRSGPAMALLFGLNMLINTQSGDVFTLREYRDWLKAAGFRKVSTMPAPHVAPIILALK
jgi:3-hydroxy-5-methyl-1-naphthoate 3-O-methyltransferase